MRNTNANAKFDMKAIFNTYFLNFPLMGMLKISYIYVVNIKNILKLCQI